LNLVGLIQIKNKPEEVKDMNFNKLDALRKNSTEILNLNEGKKESFIPETNKTNSKLLQAIKLNKDGEFEAENNDENNEEIIVYKEREFEPHSHNKSHKKIKEFTTSKQKSINSNNIDLRKEYNLASSSQDNVERQVVESKTFINMKKDLQYKESIKENEYNPGLKSINSKVLNKKISLKLKVDEKEKGYFNENESESERGGHYKKSIFDNFNSKLREGDNIQKLKDNDNENKEEKNSYNSNQVLLDREILKKEEKKDEINQLNSNLISNVAQEENQENNNHSYNKSLIIEDEE